MYVKCVLPLLKNENVRGFAHITGGGLTENTPRMLPATLIPAYDEDALSLPPVFEWLLETGNLSKEDMRRTFNCGIGGVLAVSTDAVQDVLDSLNAEPTASDSTDSLGSSGKARVIGEIKQA